MAGNPTGEEFVRLINAVGEALAEAYWGFDCHDKRDQYEAFVKERASREA